MKVIFISETPFIEQTKRDLYFDDISKNNICEVWDLAHLYNRTYSLPNEVKDKLKIVNMSDLKINIKKLPKKCLFITASRPTGESLKIFKLIRKYGHKIFYMKKDLINGEMEKISTLKIKTHIYSKLKGNVLKKIIGKLVKYIRRDFIYDFGFKISNCSLPACKNVINGHNIKYDEFNKNEIEKPLINGSYIVYLDIDLAFHHDLVNDTLIENINPDIFFRKMKTFFNYLERKYNSKVVIAAHPKSNYINEFGYREIIKFKTPNLIRNSIGVVAHLGTSIATTVLANKPIIFPYYEEMFKKATRGWIVTSFGYAQCLGSSLVNLDENYFNADFIINSDKYDFFLKNYIINYNKKNKTNSQIIIEDLIEKEFSDD